MANSNNKKIYKKNQKLTAKKIENEFVLIPVKKDAVDMDVIYNLNNEVSVRIWELIDGKCSVKEIKEIILKEFNVKKEILEKDVDDFLSNLEKEDCIII